MTNTKFRKRALLSSVAMLLVALVALGSATFAWFNTQNSAAARLITAQTEKSSDITLSEDAGSQYSPWTHDLHFSDDSFDSAQGKLATLGETTPLIPVTTKDFSSWKKVAAADSNVGYATEDYDNASKNLVSEVKCSKLYIKSTTTQDIKITPTVSADAKAEKMVRLALVPIDASGSITQKIDTKPIIWCGGTGGLNDRSATKWQAAAEASSAQPQWTTGTTAVTYNEGTANEATSTPSTVYTSLSAAHSIGEFDASSADAVVAYDVYVWVEGTDFDCLDSNAGTAVTFSFSVTEDA